MTFYRKTYHNATLDAFAREAALDVFGPRAIQALDHNDFKDRQPGQAPRLLEQITVKVARDTGQPDRGLRDD